MDCINPQAVLNHSAVENVSEIIKKKGGKISNISLINPSGCDLLAFGEHCFADSLTGIFLIGENLLYVDVEFKIIVGVYRQPLMTVSVGIKPSMGGYVASKEFIENQSLYSDIEDFVVDSVAKYLKQKKSAGDNGDN